MLRLSKLKFLSENIGKTIRIRIQEVAMDECNIRNIINVIISMENQKL